MNRFFTLMVVAVTLVSVIGCDTSSNPGTDEPTNQFVETWEALHVNQSGKYTDPIYFPVTGKKAYCSFLFKSN